MTAELVMTNTAGISSIVALWLYVMAGTFKKIQKMTARIALLVLSVSVIIYRKTLLQSCKGFLLLLKNMNSSRF